MWSCFKAVTASCRTSYGSAVSKRGGGVKFSSSVWTTKTSTEQMKHSASSDNPKYNEEFFCFRSSRQSCFGMSVAYFNCKQRGSYRESLLEKKMLSVLRNKTCRTILQPSGFVKNRAAARDNASICANFKRNCIKQTKLVFHSLVMGGRMQKKW